MDHRNCVTAIFVVILAEGAVTFNLTRDFDVLCPHTQLCSLNKTAAKNRNVPSCCSSCSCEPHCQLSRDCCPDALESAPLDDKEDEKSGLKCLPLENMLSAHIKPNKSLLLNPHYLTVQSCPKDYFNDTYAYGCYALRSSRLVDHIPVVDWWTGKLYRNFHCAVCNNITDPVPWKLESTCVALYEMNNLPETVEELRTSIGSCNALFKPPVYLQEELPKCRTDSYADVIKSCNQSGQWDALNDHLSEMCHSESYISYFIARQHSAEDTTHASDMVVFKNPACFLCNSNESTRENISCLRTEKQENLLDDTSELTMPFRVTINVDNFVYIEMKKSEKLKIIQSSVDGELTKQRKFCGFGRYMDPYKHVCREMRCPVDQYAIEGLCLMKDAEVNHLPIAVNLAVKILQARSTQYITDSSARKFVQSLNQTINEKLFKTCEIRRSVVTIFPNMSVDEVLVTVTAITNNECSVSYLLEILKHVDPDTGKPLQVKEGEFMYEIGITYADYIQNDGIDLELVNGSSIKVVHIGRRFYCPRVVLKALDYKIAVETGVFEHIDNSDYIINRLDSKTVEVCLSDYENKYREGIYNSDKETTTYTAMSIVSAVCTILSMICILITLITFAIFKELRFMPGKMFIMLCVNVLIAQLLCQFGMGTGGYGPLCVALGIAVHYFWLAVAFSMNSCILLMFNHFHCPLKISSRSAVLTQGDANSVMGRYAAYTYSCPLIFVLANIIGSLVMTKNKSIGYGGEFCYIDTGLMRGLVFVLPLGLIILINFGLFGIVLYDIMKIKVNSLKAESDNVCGQLVIFLKFSTITGIYWSFGFFYEITELEFLGYIFILLNAGQGVFLMASFLFNRKVLLLYKGLYITYVKRFKSSMNARTHSREDNEAIVVQSSEA